MVFSGDTEFEVTPLILAAGRGKLDFVEILVENKANVNYSSRVSCSICMVMKPWFIETVYL